VFARVAQRQLVLVVVNSLAEVSPAYQF